MKTILFVCTGNTCRSPMAAALYRAMGGVSMSAGLHADAGAPASYNARLAMAARGLSLNGHRAAQVTEDMVRAADLVVCMTPRHLQALRERYPAYADKIICMPLPVPDPYGGSEADYIACAGIIQRGLEQLVGDAP